MSNAVVLRLSSGAVIESKYVPHKRMEFTFMGYSVRVCKPYGAENKNSRGYNIQPLIELNTTERSSISTDYTKMLAVVEAIQRCIVILNYENDGIVIPPNYVYNGDPLNNGFFTKEVPAEVRKIHKMVGLSADVAQMVNNNAYPTSQNIGSVHQTSQNIPNVGQASDDELVPHVGKKRTDWRGIAPVSGGSNASALHSGRMLDGILANGEIKEEDRGARKGYHLPSADNVRCLNSDDDGDKLYHVCVSEGMWYVVPLGYGHKANIAKYNEKKKSYYDKYELFNYVRLIPVADVHNGNTSNFSLKDVRNIFKRDKRGSMMIRHIENCGEVVGKPTEMKLIEVVGSIKFLNDVMYYEDGESRKVFSII